MIEEFDKFERLQTLAVSAVVLDRTGKIVGVNDAWKNFGKRNGLLLPKYGVGADYLAYCGTEQKAPFRAAKILTISPHCSARGRCPTALGVRDDTIRVGDNLAYGRRPRPSVLQGAPRPEENFGLVDLR